MMAPPMPNVSGDPLAQMNTYRSYVTVIADPGAKDEIKLKAVQELSENFEVLHIFEINCLQNIYYIDNFNVFRSS